MSWAELEAYVRARAPRGFVARCKGVALDEIRACERGLGVVLPHTYVEFLRFMGESSADYHPFGGQYDHDFHLLAEYAGSATYPADQLFRVGHQVDGADVIEEPYLDLTRAGDGDTPLVTIEAGGAFRPEYVRGLGRSLAEQLTRSVFKYFGMRRAHGCRVLAVCETTPDASTAMEETLVILRRLGFSTSLPNSPRLACLETPDCAAMVEKGGDEATVLVVELAGRDERATRRIAEILVDALPGATFSN